jgi:hypothetical protein
MSVNHARPAKGVTNRARAEEAWGLNMPRWVATLADASDRLSQRGVAAAIGKSAGYVSRLVNRSYAGDYGEAERLVMAAFSDERVHCPAMATSMSLKTCMANRRRKALPQNWAHHAFARACPTCPNNSDQEDD